MRSLSATPRLEVFIAGALAFALFFAGTASIPIVGRDEARFTQAAREMLDRGDPVVPTFVGEGRYHKPILIYWLTMASYSAFGVSERAARLPSNIAGALSVMLLAWSARRRFGPGSGLLAGLLLAGTLVFHVEARGCTADMVMFLPTLAVVLAFERMVAGDDHRGLPFVFWCAMGLAILAKGPIAPAWVVCIGIGLWAVGHRWKPWEVTGMVALLVAGLWSLGPAVLLVPAGAAGWHALRSPDGRLLIRRLRFGWGVPLMLAMTVPWAVAVSVATDGEFLREAIGRHVLSRSFRAFESHGFFPGFYLVTAPMAAFPWFAVLVAALGKVRRAVGERSLEFLTAWMLGPLVLLELVQTKLVHYWMPSYPAGVLLVVGWAWTAGPQHRNGGWIGRVLLLIAGVGMAAAPLALAVYLRLDELRPTALAAGAALALATVFAGLVTWSRPVRTLWVLVVGSAVFLTVLFTQFMPALTAEALPTRGVRRALELMEAGDRAVVFTPRDDELFFYLPVDTSACWSARCVEHRLHTDHRALGIARATDYAELTSELADDSLEEVDRVRGVDLGHLRWDELVLFRARHTSDVDTPRAPS